MNKTVVLAFSGGLDTSFCVPWLIDQGYSVVTAFVDTGGVGDDGCAKIEQRAMELGADAHYTLKVGDELVERVVNPMLWGGLAYQGRYPLLCSDRYLIVEKCIELCDQLGTKTIAHGCTAMGNDQVRFDLSVPPGYEVLAPIRRISETEANVRVFEMDDLKARGFAVDETSKRYTVNENVLGVTVSGAEIDQWQEPSPASYIWLPPPGQEASGELRIKFDVQQGVLSANGMSGEALLTHLNETIAPYGVGRGSYTGDTTIGLKGRIAFEAPGITVMMSVLNSLAAATLSRYQNDFRPVLAQKWCELVYHGLYSEPLRLDLELALKQMMQRVTGSVEMVIRAGQSEAVTIESPYLLVSGEASYAQSASWSAVEAEGFVRLYGQGTRLWQEKGQ